MKRTRELLINPAGAMPEPAQVFAAICQDVCDNVDCDLGSVWLFDQSRTRITCQSRYDALAETFSEGTVLTAAEYPTYFRHILEETFVNAPHAQQQVATREFTPTYFEPLGIVSLLDFVIHRSMEPVGIICCENRRGIRDWSAKDQDYLKGISALASVYFRTARR